MQTIVEMRAGSHLYGTNTPASDLDLKSVYLPSARDLLLQQVKGVIVGARPKAQGERNAPGDVDREAYSLQRFLTLLADGQTMALDMLFAPNSAMTAPPAPLWREIQANAHRLVSRRSASFLGYCRQQASKFGARGLRVEAARAMLAALTEAEARLGATAKLESIAAELEIRAAQGGAGAIPHVALIDIPAPGGALIRHLEICGRKTPYTASIKIARESPSGFSTNTENAAWRPRATKAWTGNPCPTPCASAARPSNCSRPGGSPCPCPAPDTSCASSSGRSRARRCPMKSTAY